MANLIESHKSIAYEDALRYAQTLLSNGGTNIYENEEFPNIESWFRELYAIAGRIDSYSLRPSQNMGTGATGYSFLGKPFTIVPNSGTAQWDASANTGIALVGNYYNGGYILIDPSRVLPLPLSVFMVMSTPAVNTSGDAGRAAFTNDGSSGASAGQTVAGSFSTLINSSYYSSNSAAFYGAGWPRSYMIFGEMSGTTGTKLYRNGSLLASAGLQKSSTDATPTTTTDTSITGSGFGTGTQIMDTNTGGVSVSFAMSLPITLTASQHAAIYAAYKSTIGQGLGLS